METVRIETSRFGALEIPKSHVITFISPILGFDHLTEYVLLDHADNSPFKWLQSTQDPELAFVVTNPKLFAIAYEFVLPDDAVEKLGVKTAEDVLVFTIVNVPTDNPARMTANLLAPVVVNQNALTAMQVVLQDPKLSTRTRLLPDKAEDGEPRQEVSSGQSGKGS